MGRKRWQAAWDEGRLGFHQSDINADLRDHIGWLAGARTGSVLVPLCGKSRDMTWLADAFDRVVGVEFIAEACEAFFVEQDLPHERQAEGDVVRWTSGPFTILQADFMALTPEVVGPVDAVYDRAAMIALPKGLRAAYALTVARLADPGARGLLVTLGYDQAAVDGPPFAVLDDEVRARYEPTFRLERAPDTTFGGLPPRFEGVTATKSIWLTERIGDR